MIASPLAPKWPILIPFCGLDHQKSKFLLVSCNFDVRGCWGQPILLFWKNIDKTQMSPSPKCAATFFWTWKSTLVGHLGLQSMSYWVGTPCNPSLQYILRFSCNFRKLLAPFWRDELKNCLSKFTAVSSSRLINEEFRFQLISCWFPTEY